MKLSLLALFFGFSVHASDFTPELCSRDGNGSATLAKVCIGTYAGETGKILELTRADDGYVRYFTTDLRTSARRMGPSYFNFTGDVLIYRVHDPVTGVLEVVNGITVSYAIELETSTGLKYAGPLYAVGK